MEELKYRKVYEQKLTIPPCTDLKCYTCGTNSYQFLEDYVKHVDIYTMRQSVGPDGISYSEIIADIKKNPGYFAFLSRSVQSTGVINAFMDTVSGGASIVLCGIERYHIHGSHQLTVVKKDPLLFDKSTHKTSEMLAAAVVAVTSIKQIVPMFEKYRDILRQEDAMKVVRAHPNLIMHIHPDLCTFDMLAIAVKADVKNYHCFTAWKAYMTRKMTPFMEGRPGTKWKTVGEDESVYVRTVVPI